MIIKWFTKEWIFFTTIEIILLVFFIISIINLANLKERGLDDKLLRTSVNIGIECIIIIIGFFMFTIYRNKGIMSQVQIRFCLHLFPFLVLTGITALISSSHVLENLLKNKPA